MRWFADRGYLVVSVDYRLATASQSTWDKARQDVACALTWIHQNAPRYGGDPQRIVVAGDSAGGNLAVNLAYSAALGRALSGCGGQVPIPEAVLVQYPIVAPQDAFDNGYPIRGFEPKMCTGRYLGMFRTRCPTAW
jgi:acetyl esterase/lipase